MEPQTENFERLKGPGDLRWEDYVELPDDGKRYEILDGELYVSPAPTWHHQHILMYLSHVLFTALEQTGRGKLVQSPVDVRLNERDIAQPDLVYIRQERLGIIGDQVMGAPDLVVEVLSKSTRKRDRGIKAERYAKAGVTLYWIIDPFRNAIEVYTPEGERFRQVAVVCSPNKYESPDLPGVVVDLAWLFQSA